MMMKQDDCQSCVCFRCKETKCSGCKTCFGVKKEKNCFFILHPIKVNSTDATLTDKTH